MRKSFGALAVIAILLTAAFASPSMADSKGVANENAVGYWTDARMKSAVALELVVDPKTKIGVLRSQLPSPNIVAVDQSDWGLRGGLPQTAVGKVYFTMNNTDYVCSGSLVSDNSDLSALVITAGHCVIDKGKFAKNWMFIPNFDTFGTLASVPVAQRWYATNLIVRSEFANSMQFNTTAVQHDWAFAVIKQGTFSKDGISRYNSGPTLPDSGSNSFGFIPVNPGFTGVGSNSTAFGYPQAAPYNGLSLKFAWGSIFADTSMSTWGMPSYLTGGASGGPWLSAPTDDPTNQPSSYSLTGTVASINSYKYTNNTTNMYGPRFNQKTTATRMAAMDDSCIKRVSICVSNLVVSGGSATSTNGYTVTRK